MCLLKVYIEGGKGIRTLVASDVARVSVDGRTFRILDVEGREKVVLGANFLMIDALNSTLVLKAEEEVEIKGSW